MGRKKGGPKTGGRKKGVPNKATADVKALAQEPAPSAVAELGRLAQGAESEQARLGACRELLDRAVGKPAASVAVEHAERVPAIFIMQLHAVALEEHRQKMLEDRRREAGALPLITADDDNQLKE